MSTHRVEVGPLPTWLDRAALLGEGWSWDIDQRIAGRELETADAADVSEGLRGQGLDGQQVVVGVWPRLKRPAVRAARTRAARARRHTSPGFLRPGARLDDEGRFSLTSEPLALALGKRHAGKRVLDVCCGAGGNSIGFARAGCAVVAVELEASRLALARHNAGVYGVRDRIRFLHGDGLEACTAHPADLVFVDPPWGGESYDRAAMHLHDLPLLEQLLERCALPLVAKVPASFVTTEVDLEVEAVFGVAEGDRQRIKYLLLSRGL